MLNNIQELYHDIVYDDVVFIEENFRAGLGFRKTLIMLAKENVYTFFIKIRQVKENKSIWESSVIQSVMIDAPCNGLSLLLNKEEMERLYKMLEIANNFFAENVSEDRSPEKSVLTSFLYN